MPVVRRGKLRAESADALNRSLRLPDLDVILDLEGLQQQYRHSSDKVAQRALHGQGNSHAGRAHKRDKAGQGNAHHICRSQHDDEVKNNLNYLEADQRQFFYYLYGATMPKDDKLISEIKFEIELNNGTVITIDDFSEGEKKNLLILF